MYLVPGHLRPRVDDRLCIRIGPAAVHLGQLSEERGRAVNQSLPGGEYPSEEDCGTDLVSPNG